MPLKEGVFPKEENEGRNAGLQWQLTAPQPDGMKGNPSSGTGCPATRHLISKGPALPRGSSVSHSPAPCINLVPLGKFSSESWPYLPGWEGSGEGPFEACRYGECNIRQAVSIS